MSTISVIISTYSKGKFNQVLDCLSSLQRQSLAPLEIILVLDPDQELVDFYKSQVPMDIKIVVSRDFGLCAARNEGVKVSNGEIVAFIDDDATADEHWLEHMITNYRDLSVVGVGGFIKPFWGSERPVWFPEELDWIIGCSYKGLPDRKASLRNPIGCNMSFRRSVFEKIGYFCSDVGRRGTGLLLDGEEAELCLRIFDDLPYSKVMYDPFSIVYHKVEANRLTIKYLTKRAFYQGVSKAIIANLKSRSKPLSPEHEYFKFLLRKAIPSRLKRIYNIGALSQLAVLSLSLFAVFAGFFFGLFRRKWKSEKNK